ncbi:hypothetical protein RHMOL_Rhmol04G0142600 [Rhododendron molle]|uniref:Uncharacterized protein n=1 Tax=Rhododendron molle TaxID=49168 RepID=A0ACC0P078_RHOML|nr:hypothetical protein RHMOL_Rhmol04G0142600 [Rhododendron molle]
MDAAARRQLGHHSLVVIRGFCGWLKAFLGSAIYGWFTAVYATVAAFHILIEFFGQEFVQVVGISGLVMFLGFCWSLTNAWASDAYGD